MLDNEAIAEILDKELSNALSIDRSLDGGSRQMAVDYYLGVLPANDTVQPRALGGSLDDTGLGDGSAVPEDPNRAAVSLDVADMVEAVVAQLLPALEAPGAIEFEAMGPDDEVQAQQESAIVRSVLMEGRAGEGGFVALSEGVKDALLMRTGVFALWVDRKETRTPEEWESVPGASVGELVSPNQEGQRVEGVSIELQEADENAEGEEKQELYRVKLTRVDVDKRLALAAVPRESFVTSNAGTRDANQARFCADRLLMTRSDWIAEGLPESELEDLPQWIESGDEGYVERSRTVGWSEASQKSAQEATEILELWRCYVVLAEKDGDATGRRYRVFYSRAARKVIGKPEQVGRVCYALGVVTIFPHRLEGVSLWDSIAELQELKSKGLRNWTENLHRVNRPRIGVDETLVNLADAQDATQDIVRMRGPNGIVPVPCLDAGPSVLAFLNFCDQARSERGGASLDMQAGAMQIAANQTAQGIERQYSTKEARAAMMARTFAETGMRQVWLSAHYLLRTQWGGEIAAKIGGQWQTADPSKWRARSGVIVHVGESRTQAAQRAGALQGVMSAQTGLSQVGKGGGILTDDTRGYNALIDWAYANNLRAPERYFIDPASPESQKAQQAAQRAAQQGQAMQAAMARAAMMLEKYKVDQKSLTDLIGTLVKAAIEEAKLTLMPDPIEEAQMIAGQAAGEANQAQQADVAAVQGKPNGAAAGGVQ
jgi:hypothetical protein